MNSKITIKYDAVTKNPTIECEGNYFTTEKLYGIDIADWAYPSVLNGNRWNGLYDELREFYGMDSYSVIFHGADSDLAVLKQAFEGRPVNVVGLNNKVVIIYDGKQLTTKITVNGKIFDTAKLTNRTIDEWVNPFSFKENEWQGIFTEIESFLGTNSYSIQFMGNLEDMRVLMDNCPDNVNITYKSPVVPKKKPQPAPTTESPVHSNPAQSERKSDLVINIQKPDMDEVKNQAKGLLRGAKEDYLKMQDKDFILLLYGMITYLAALYCSVAVVSALFFIIKMGLLALVASFGPASIFNILSFTKGYKRISIITLILSAIIILISALIMIIRGASFANDLSNSFNGLF